MSGTGQHAQAVVDHARPHVLVAEDDARMRHLLATMLRRDGFDVTEARDGAELLDWVGEQGSGLNPVDLIITDIRMPTLSGLQVLTELRWDGCPIPIIIITAFGDERTHASAMQLGAVAVFDKPFDLGHVCSAARHFIAVARAAREGHRSASSDERVGRAERARAEGEPLSR